MFNILNFLPKDVLSNKYKEPFLIFFLLLPLSFFILFLFSNYYYFLPLGNNEASHLLVARSVFYGNLPYIEHFDPRGPLLYYIYAISFFFPDFLVGFYILNYLVIFLSCLISYKIGVNLYSKKSGIFSCLFSGLILSQGYNPENLIFLFLYLFIYFTILKLDNFKISSPIFAGVFVSCATLIRFNISVLAIIGFLFFLTQSKKKILYTATYVISGLIPLLILIILYSHETDGLKIFWNSTFAYSINLPQGRPFYIGIYQLMDSFVTLAWSSLFILSILSFFIQKQGKKIMFFLLIFFLFSFFSVLLARKFNDHYFLVSSPFLIVAGSSIINNKILQSKKIITIIFIICFTNPLLENFYNKIKLYYRPGNFSFFLSELLRNHIKPDENIFSSINGVYLHMNKKNFLKLVDASHFNNNRHYNYESVYAKKITFLDEFNNVLVQEPNFLIFDQNFKNGYFYKDVLKNIEHSYIKYQFYDENKLQVHRKNFRDEIKTIEVYKLQKN
jgi:hypothetical protein